jgi:wyosine [tRNA(Phe)-imidazoG37] synthetase (radical SAM superfamily)
MLFNDYIFGPIVSRRLGRSLGVNLLPKDNKFCNYNCIYCECGWNSTTTDKPLLPTCEQIIEALKAKLQILQQSNALPDAITFSGNGEPTLHPQFSQIVEQVIAIRNQFSTRSKICILTNAAATSNEQVCAALKKADIAMLKLDAGTDATFWKINQPNKRMSIADLMAGMQNLKEKLVVQSMFLQGELNGIPFDNSAQEELTAWLQCLRLLQPCAVVVYSLDRPAPLLGLKKVDSNTLKQIAAKVEALGIKAEVYE